MKVFTHMKIITNKIINKEILQWPNKDFLF